jgi:CRISPR system Cascade subunit CasB
MTDSQTAGEKFTDFIEQLGTGPKATLRRSLAFPPGTWPAAFPYVEPWVRGQEGWTRSVAYLVAGLQAQSRITAGKGNLGEAAARLAKAADSKSIETRFIALLDADADQLSHRLRQMITLMSSHTIAPDWAQLNSDLRWWRHADRYVQQRWARSFYAVERDDASSADTGDSQEGG